MSDLSASDFLFHDKGISDGIWHGRLTGEAMPRRVCLVVDGRIMAETRLEPAAGDGADIALPVPPQALRGGLVTLRLMADMASPRADLADDAHEVATLSVLIGDLQAEIMLMRSEIDLLKRSLRRLANEA